MKLREGELIKIKKKLKEEETSMVNVTEKKN